MLADLSLTMTLQYTVNEIDEKLLGYLLQDHTTQKNIIWATDDYSYLGQEYEFAHEITLSSITGNYRSKLISPRVYKSKDQQSQRTKSKAEVFTPSWVCNAQNNLVDEAWFGRENVFNTVSDNGKIWKATEEKIEFPKGKTWKDYVTANRMEITCGEAPYLVSRYDTTTGENISISQRIGMLDRKLRIVSENTSTLKEWLKWAELAFKAIYGFEYQGDSLLIGRINLLKTFQEYLEIQKETREGTVPKNICQKIADIISYNLWQMDGLTYTIPGGVARSESDLIQGTLFDEEETEAVAYSPYSLLKDWETEELLTFKSLVDKK